MCIRDRQSTWGKQFQELIVMAKRTKKVGITRKYGTRYGASLRKIIKKFEIQQHARYLCPFCGKQSVRRVSIGIWQCRGCYKTVAGGAWSLTTSAALTAKSTMVRLKKMREDVSAAEAVEAKNRKEAAKKKDEVLEQASKDVKKQSKGAKEGGAKGGKGGKGGQKPKAK
eukprot:TRINITY_DN145_c0_g1_i5.p1 TRINITY_DN145_c0_g1~~TRINITY_DN145_c0_g1_i5.p1  ORF type:complete len:169 (+),score=65.94 TRINITY_DN145_c0_g1_i5:92-598(+)